MCLQAGGALSSAQRETQLKAQEQALSDRAEEVAAMLDGHAKQKATQELLEAACKLEARGGGWNLSDSEVEEEEDAHEEEAELVSPPPSTEFETKSSYSTSSCDSSESDTDSDDEDCLVRFLDEHPEFRKHQDQGPPCTQHVRKSEASSRTIQDCVLAHRATQEPHPDATQEPQHDATLEPQHDATQEPQHAATRGPHHDAHHEEGACSSQSGTADEACIHLRKVETARLLGGCVQTLPEGLAGKLTGMVLEMDELEVLQYIESPVELRSIVLAATQKLADHLFILGDDVVRSLGFDVNGGTCVEQQARAHGEEDERLDKAVDGYRQKRVVAKTFLTWRLHSWCSQSWSAMASRAAVIVTGRAWSKAMLWARVLVQGSASKEISSRLGSGDCEEDTSALTLILNGGGENCLPSPASDSSQSWGLDGNWGVALQDMDTLQDMHTCKAQGDAPLVSLKEPEASDYYSDSEEEQESSVLISGAASGSALRIETGGSQSIPVSPTLWNGEVGRGLIVPGDTVTTLRDAEEEYYLSVPGSPFWERDSGYYSNPGEAPDARLCEDMRQLIWEGLHHLCVTMDEYGDNELVWLVEAKRVAHEGLLASWCWKDAQARIVMEMQRIDDEMPLTPTYAPVLAYVQPRSPAYAPVTFPRHGIGQY